MNWLDIQSTTETVTQERLDLLPAWLYMLLTSEKLRNHIGMGRAPSQQQLSSLIEISEIAAELVAEYHETNRAARARAESGEEP